MQGFIVIKNNDNTVSYTPISGFTTTELGCRKGKDSYTFINKYDGEAEFNTFNSVFNSLWNSQDKVVDVKDKVLESIKVAYTDQSPEFIYFFALYNLFKDYLEDNANGDNFANESTGLSINWKSITDVS